MRRYGRGWAVGLLALAMSVALFVWSSATTPRARRDAPMGENSPGAAPTAAGFRSVVEDETTEDAGLPNPDDVITGVVTADERVVPNAEVALFDMTGRARDAFSGTNQAACGDFQVRSLAVMQLPGNAPQQRVLTDEKGAFLFRVQRGTRYSFTVTAGALRETVFFTRGGSRWTVRLAPASAARGQLRFPDGGVVAGASLAAYAWETGELVSGISDATGSFSFERPVSEQLLVRVEAPGFPAQVIVRPAGVFTLSTLRTSGIVQRGGMGMGGVEVSGQGHTTISESDGSFVLDANLCMSELLSARRGELRASGLAIPGRALELEPASRLTVVLTSSAPALLSNAKFELNPGHADQRGPSKQTLSTAVFEDLVSQEWYLTVSAPGLSTVAQWLDLAPGEDREVRIELQPVVSLRGRVVDDADGKPAADLQVRLDALGQTRVSEPQRLTNEDGRFTFPEVGPGRYRVTVSGGEFFELVQEVSPGSEVTLRVTRGGRVVGKVSYEGRDRPPPDFIVSVVPADGPVERDEEALASVFVGTRRGASRMGRSSAPGALDVEVLDDGRFRTVPLRPGGYRVVVVSPGRTHPMTQRLVEVTGTALTNGDVLVPRGLSIKGRVLDEAGQPAVAKVTASQSGRALTFWTEDDGTFTLSGLVPGNWLLRAHRIIDRRQAFGAAQAGADDVVLTLSWPRLISVTLLDSAGQPLSSARMKGRLGLHVVEGEFELDGGSLVLSLPVQSGELVFESGNLKSKALPFPASGDVALGSVQLE